VVFRFSYLASFVKYREAFPFLYLYLVAMYVVLKGLYLCLA
jgi:hypothetical protein